MIVNRALSQRIEEAVCHSHQSYTDRAGGHTHGDFAFYSGENSPFSQVVGWGFYEKDLESLEAIEGFYRECGSHCCPIELSPFVGNEALKTLAERGYQTREVNQISVVEMNRWLPTGFPEEVEIRISDDVAAWAKVVAEGFEQPEMAGVFETYGLSEGVFPFEARFEGTLCAGGTIAIDREVADLGVMSTIPKFRGRGIQKGLLVERLQFALNQGVKIASVTTEPGTISDGNIQKRGFHPCYTRIKLEKPLES